MTAPNELYYDVVKFYYRYKQIAYDKPVPNEVHRVIVFVHGRNGRAADFKPLIENIKDLNQFCGLDYTQNTEYHQRCKVNDQTDVITLENQEMYALRTIDLGVTGSTTVDQDVDRLRHELELYGNRNIILVGLSKGGLVVMRLATKFNDTRIRKIITISSPLHGTYIANFFPVDSPVYQSLGFNSQLSQEIDRDRSSLKIPVHHVVPNYDILIVPTWSAYYQDTPKSNIYYYKGWYGHSGITFAKEVADAIYHWINLQCLI